MNNFAALKKRLQKEQRIIAEARDRLRDIYEDAAHLHESCEAAHDDIESAIDHLSETV